MTAQLIKQSNPFCHRALLLGIALFLFASTLAATAQADNAAKAQEVVDRALVSFKSMASNTAEYSDMLGKLKGAKAVVILPQVLKGGFILGGEGGTGVLMARGRDRSWSAPAFVSFFAGSIGLQIGGQVSEIVLVVMNDQALEALLSNNVKFGADLDISAGHYGKGVEAGTTTNLEADVFAYSDSVGLFGGGSLEGGALVSEDDYNAGYYGKSAVTARDIVIDRRYGNINSEALRAAVAQASR